MLTRGDLIGRVGVCLTKRIEYIGHRPETNNKKKMLEMVKLLVNI